MIETRIDQERGCGEREEGGLYMVAGNLSNACYKLPIPLTVCPCCHAGIKPSRGWTWVNKKLTEDTPCRKKGCKGCVPFDGSVDSFGLIWVGEKFYKSPYEFNKEAMLQGISRRISAIPNDFVLGETWVLLAHRKAIKDATAPITFMKKDIFPTNGPEKGLSSDLVAKWDEDEKHWWCTAITNKTVGISKHSTEILKELEAYSGISWYTDTVSQHVFHADNLALGKRIKERDLYHYTPGVFSVFRPTAIEYVVKEEDAIKCNDCFGTGIVPDSFDLSKTPPETPCPKCKGEGEVLTDKMKALEKRGVTLIRIKTLKS